MRKRSRSPNGALREEGFVTGSLDAIRSSMQLSNWDNEKEHSNDEFANTFFKTLDWIQAVYLPCRRSQLQEQVQRVKNPRLDQDHEEMKAATATTSTSPSATSSLTCNDIPSLFQRLNRQDQDSWCVETDSSAKKQQQQDQQPCLTPNEFWNKHSNNKDSKETTEHHHHHHRRAYCSFLVQHDASAYQETLERLPLPELWKPVTPSNTTDRCTAVTKLVYEPCLWFFFGWNVPNDDIDPEDLQGRPEHTDSITHDGTWHYQLSGSKHWYLRPSIKLLEHWKERLYGESESASPSFFISKLDLEQWLQEPETAPTLCIPCNEGDVIVVNTRLWWHRTILPPQSAPSVSYARDFRVRGSSDTATEHAAQQHPQPRANDDTTTANNNNIAVVVGMTNVDGLYATKDIEEGTILFTETDMPDCELHRSAEQWNCQVVELVDGTSAVVSCRPIAAGEFFCVPDSDEEEDEDDNEMGQDDFVCVEIDESGEDEV